MTIQERLNDDIKTAMRAKDSLRLNTIRMLKSRLQEKESELRGKKGRDYRIDDEEAMQVIGTYAKQRRDAIAAFDDAGRKEMADKERAELEILHDYLPKQLSDEDLKAVVAKVIQDSGASSMKDMGRVMKSVLDEVKGQADGSRVSPLVKQALG